jgi:hypothetical protein
MRRLRVRLAVTVTTLAMLLGIAVLPASYANGSGTSVSISGEPGEIVAFAPATAETVRWRPVNEADVPSWLFANGLGNFAEDGRTMTELVVQILEAPYGTTTTFSIAEYTRNDQEVIRNLTVTVGAGITMLSPVTANAVAGAESYVPVRGENSPTRGTAGWRASGGPAWLDGASTNGKLENGRYALMFIRVPADVPVGSEWTTRITEQQRAADGRDLGQLQYDLTLRIRPPLESNFPTQQYTTQFDEPLVVPEARLTTQLPSPDDLRVTGASAALNREASTDGATVSWTPELTDAGKVVPVTWEVGYEGVGGYAVPRTAAVRVTFDEGPRPVAGRSTVQKKLRAGKQVRIPLGVGAQHSTPFLWQVKLHTVKRTGSQLNPDAIRAEVQTVGERSYAVLRTTKAARPGGYYVVSKVTDRYGKSAKHRLATIQLRR